MNTINRRGEIGITRRALPDNISCGSGSRVSSESTERPWGHSYKYSLTPPVPTEHALPFIFGALAPTARREERGMRPILGIGIPLLTGNHGGDLYGSRNR